MIKDVLKMIFGLAGFQIKRKSYPPKHLRDREYYQPLFSPWHGYGEFRDLFALASPFSVVSAERMYLLYGLAKQMVHKKAAWFECGVYKGGTARLLTSILTKYSVTHPIQLHLFDTFEGMPQPDSQKDFHNIGDFKDTSFEAVKMRIREIDPSLNYVQIHKGHIPQTFKNVEDCQISLAHVDVDIYRSIMDCCEFIYPRMITNGILVFDDYGFPSCPGARQAVDDFFSDKKEVPLILPTGQALVFKF